ncbi:MAG TPA: efflux RND transporter periplasmic adaptor subunit [Gemmatimonadales bacterium]|nr:efflux RND transporter periplasmic adaptor subunit [Gemmatimonadales bacterium]
MDRANEARKLAAGDAITELVGVPARPVGSDSRRKFWRRPWWAVLTVLVLAPPAYLSLQYRLQHVTSKNAAVRGHVAEIGTRISGLVASVAVDAGDRVKAGQVLVRLEDRHLLAEVEEARAEVAGLERSMSVETETIGLERSQIAGQEAEAAAKISAAKANAEAARVEAEEARRNHELQDTMHSHGMVSTEELRNAESRRRAAEARLDEAQANAVMAQRSAEQGARQARDAVTIRASRVAVLDANLAAARARLARAEADLASATIRAPEDGAIIRRIIQPGGAVDAGRPVISMWLGSNLWVEAWIDEASVRFVRRGARATVTFHSLPDVEFAGRVDRVGLSTDLEVPESDVPKPRFTRMDGAPVVGVRILLDQPPPELVPGLSAVVAIEKER